MRLLTKSIICAAILLVSIGVAPSVRADGITIESSGFSLTNLGSSAGVNRGFDSLAGVGTHTVTNPALGDHTSPFLMNFLTLTTGFTGPGSHGTHDFTFSQLITINGVTQTLQMTGAIDIGSAVDSVHIISSTPLTFQFSTFSVDMRVLPMTIDGPGAGVFSDTLLGEYTIRTNTTSPVPEPATLSLFGLGLAGVAAKIRQRRRLRALRVPSTSEPST